MWFFAAVALVLAVVVPGFRRFVFTCLAIGAVVVGCQIAINSIHHGHRAPTEVPQWAR